MSLLNRSCRSSIWFATFGIRCDHPVGPACGSIASRVTKSLVLASLDLIGQWMNDMIFYSPVSRDGSTPDGRAGHTTG
eukprot:scaffold37156_cov43-Cyclotella_meneghiniana.AAC.1